MKTYLGASGIVIMQKKSHDSEIYLPCNLKVKNFLGALGIFEMGKKFVGRKSITRFLLSIRPLYSTRYSPEYLGTSFRILFYILPTVTGTADNSHY